MKLQGFIGPAYTLDSVNVEAQRCVNLYPEIIESGSGKEGNVAYLKGTPGLEKIVTVGNGPIRLVHRDSVGRIFAVSGNELYRITHIDDWKFSVVSQSYTTHSGIAQTTEISTGSDTVTKASHGYYTGLPVRVSSTNTIPTGLASATDYWIIRVDANTVKFATNLANAVAGTAIDITAVGAGNLTITPQVPSTISGIKVVADVDADENKISYSSHSLNDGQHVKLETIGTSLPGGLAVDTSYYVIKLNANEFQLATSVSNASAGTEIDLTAATGDWEGTLVTSDGTDSGTSVLFSTSSGPVKASSMSTAGDGTDSSTVFVDGVSNYLFQDDAGVESFSVIGTINVAEAVLNVTDDVTIWTSENVTEMLGWTIEVEAYSVTPGPGNNAKVLVRE